MSNFKNLKVYQLSFDSAMEIFEVSKTFPTEEKYSLTDQVRRSSRSVSACIAESYRKRQYPSYFISKLSDADMECAETVCWIDFTLSCGYILAEQQLYLQDRYKQIGKLIGYMMKNSEKFQ